MWHFTLDKMILTFTPLIFYQTFLINFFHKIFIWCPASWLGFAEQSSQTVNFHLDLIKIETCIADCTLHCHLAPLETFLSWTDYMPFLGALNWIVPHSHTCLLKRNEFGQTSILHQKDPIHIKFKEPCSIKSCSEKSYYPLIRCALCSAIQNSRMWTWAVLITRLKLLAKTSAIHNRWVKAEKILIQTKSVTFSNGKVVFCFVNLLGFKYLRKVYPRLHESDKFLQTQVNNWKNKL